jgi:hypothetical protein
VDLSLDPDFIASTSGEISLFSSLMTLSGLREPEDDMQLSPGDALCTTYFKLRKLSSLGVLSVRAFRNNFSLV